METRAGNTPVQAEIFGNFHKEEYDENNFRTKSPTNRP